MNPKTLEVILDVQKKLQWILQRCKIEQIADFSVAEEVQELLGPQNEIYEVHLFSVGFAVFFNLISLRYFLHMLVVTRVRQYTLGIRILSLVYVYCIPYTVYRIPYTEYPSCYPIKNLPFHGYTEDFEKIVVPIVTTQYFYLWRVPTSSYSYPPNLQFQF
jgi:hypothetical protein